MRLGKLTNEQLDRLILSKLKHTRKEVICCPQVGVDCAAVDLGGRLAVLSTDPITSADKSLGALTVHVSCNDAAAAGAEPVGMLVTLLAPPSATEEMLDEFANDLTAAAELAGIEIIGGHTEVTDSVTRMVTCATIIAKSGPAGILTPAGMKAGDAILLTKHAGLEGAAVIAADRGQTLSGVCPADIEEAKGFMGQVSVVKEGAYAAAHGATAMHDVTEGGVLGAAWEMANASGLGITLFRNSIPVHPATARICNALGLNPLKLLSSGAMLIACGDGEGLAAGLQREGIPARVIGYAGGEGVRFDDGQEIAPPEADEIYKLFD